MEKTNAEGKSVASDSKNQETYCQKMKNMHDAATNHNTEKLQNKPLDQILTPSGNTILHIYIINLPSITAESKKKTEKATQQGDKFVTEVLGSCSNLLLKANHKGETPLHFAARFGQGDVAEELIEESTKACHADQEDGVEMKKKLLKMTNEAGDTALHEAVRYNHCDVVTKLINADVELTYEANYSGETPLYLAAERGYKDVVNTILEKCKSPADHGPMARTALHAAVIRGDAEMVKLLLDKKKNLMSEKDEQGRFPLHYAAFLGYDKIVDSLVENRSEAYECDNDGNTALLLAAGSGKATTVEILVKECPNCWELVDKRGRNALHLALTSADDSTIKIFLKNPALGNLINQKDKEGNTPLLQLANSVSNIRIFIDHHKVDKLVFNKENKNAADIVLAKGWIMDDQASFLERLEMIKGCRRIIVPKQEIREGKINQRSTISVGKLVNYVTVKGEQSEVINKPKGAEINDEGSEEIIGIIKGVGETHLVAATLIATVTFAAGFTMPGGYIGENNRNEGTALLARRSAFQTFVIFDTIAFVLSCTSVHILLRMGLQKDKIILFNQFKQQLKLTHYAMIAMVFAFITGIYAVLYPDKSLAITASVIVSLFGAYFSRSIPRSKDLMRLLKKKKRTPKPFYED